MPRKAQRTQKKQIVAFKVEDELARFLDSLPNKSEFIRRAILAQFNMTCPLCAGSGVVEAGIHEHFRSVIEANLSRPCENCKTAVSFPLHLEAVPPADRDRIGQFFHGGPLYCSKCYPNVPSCDDCGWHVTMEKIADHFRKVHARNK